MQIHNKGRGKQTLVSFELPGIIQAMVQHPNMYVRFNLFVVRGLDSKHSIALCELLMDYLNLGQFRCDIVNFKKLMGIKEGQYAYSTMLRKRVLEVAVNEINDKNIMEVSYELEKQGRKLVAIHFTMRRKQTQTTGEIAHAEIRSKLKQFGIAESRIEELMTHHDEQYLRANMAIVEEQAKKGNIKNIAAYLLKAFQNDYRIAETEYAQQQKAIALEKEVEQKVVDAAEQKRKELEQQFYQERNVAIENKLTDLSTSEKASLQAEFEAEMLATDALSAVFKSKGIDNPIIQGQRKKFIAERFLAKKYKNFANYKQSKEELSK